MQKWLFRMCFDRLGRHRFETPSLAFCAVPLSSELKQKIKKVRPDNGPGSQVKVLEPFQTIIYSMSSGSG